MSVQLTVPDYITPEPEKPPIVLWLGATWNQKLAYEMRDLCSQEFAIKGASIWWSPAINLHRTAYSGRNFEYFAEDGVFSGLMGTQWVKASQANGVVTQLKHFFLNDQETNRGANGRLATFADEQTMRELYLKPFQMCIEDGGAMGTVNTMCRIGTVCSPSRYSANVSILRNEWGMTGAIITDAQSFNEREAEQALAAGCDMVCSTAKTAYSDATLSSPGGQYMLRQGAKNILYITANGFAADSAFSKGYPIYRIALIVNNILTAIYLAWFTLEVIGGIMKKQLLSKKTMRAIRIILGALGILILLFLLYKLFTEWLPMLKIALQTAV